MTRVIAGTHGGRRLRTPAGRDTRPTAERVREALFSALGDVGGARVLDLFCGSGALAIEALSRGAASAVLVDRDARAAEVAQANLDALGLAGEVWRTDHRAALRRARQRGDAYDLVLIDPPYRDAPGLAGELVEALPAVLAAGARIVVESDRRAPLELPLPLVRERRYGDTLLRMHISS